MYVDIYIYIFTYILHTHIRTGVLAYASAGAPVRQLYPHQHAEMCTQRCTLRPSPCRGHFEVLKQCLLKVHVPAKWLVNLHLCACMLVHLCGSPGYNFPSMCSTTDDSKSCCHCVAMVRRIATPYKH